MAEPCFCLEGVGFAYDGSNVLDGIDLSLARGRFHGIIGPNGSGKTTLLDLLARVKQPAAGRITFRGRPLTDIPRRELARHLAMVPQEFAIGFAFTVHEVVLMGRYPHLGRFASPGDEDLRLVEEAMRRLKVWELRHRLVPELSGGEKQRVVVARALAQGAEVLLLDEATSNLDIHHTLEILQVLRAGVRGGQTVVAAIHDLNLAAAFCDDLTVLDRGRVVCHGPADQVLTAELVGEVFGVRCKLRFDPFSRARQLSFQYHAEGER